MGSEPGFHGLRTVVYPVRDLDAAKAWYSAVLAQEPYFDQPFYVGYSVGGYELGLLPDATEVGPVTYWGVADAEAAQQRLIDLGATMSSPVHDVGDGIELGTVRDPDGNLIGVIRNPNFKPT